MDIQDNSWSLEEMNYTLSLVVAVPKLDPEVIPCLRVYIADCNGQLDYMCRIVNIGTNVYNT